MLKIGEREVTYKEMMLAGLFAAVAILAVLAMIRSRTKAPPPPPLGQLAYPRGLAADSQGDLYVADSRNHRVQKFSGKDLKALEAFSAYGKVEGDAKKLKSVSLGKLNEPNGVTMGPEDDVYVVDTWNSRVQVFSAKGKFKAVMTAEDGFWGPRDLAVDSNGFVYVADTGKHRIVKFDPKGTKVQAWGIKGAKSGEFNEPIGLALDPANNLYVADRLNFRIQVFGPNGQFVREWPVKGWSPDQIDMEPHLALDKVHSLLYATDGKGKKVLCFRLDGTKLPDILKDAFGAPFQTPLGVAADRNGNIFVTDAGAGRITKLAAAQ